MNNQLIPSPLPPKQKVNGKRLYVTCEPYAEFIKTLLQMLIGFTLGLIILIKAISHLGVRIPIPNQLVLYKFVLYYIYGTHTLAIVSLTLAYSAAIELAYMLFTPGPDEAVEPLITGLAAAILLGISHIETTNINEASGIAVLVLALGGLFYIKKIFIESKEDKPTQTVLMSETSIPILPTNKTSSNISSETTTPIIQEATHSVEARSDILSAQTTAPAITTQPTASSETTTSNMSSGVTRSHKNLTANITGQKLFQVNGFLSSIWSLIRTKKHL